MINGALEFDGTEDYVEVADNETLQQWERFTIAAWINQYESRSSGMRIIDKCTAGTSNGPHMDTYPGTVIRSCSGSSCDSTPSQHTLNEWHYVAVTYDQGDKKIYVDGLLEQTATTSSPLAGNTISLTIGCDSNKANLFMGMIDEAAYFGRVLTEDEILVAMEGLGADPRPQAFGPNPKDGTMLDVTWANITWRAGDLAVSHDLYFGTSFDDVNKGAEGTFVGNLATTSQIVGFMGFPVPDGLQPGTTYYWRVDVNDADPNSPWKGDIWSFWIQPNTAYDGIPTDSEINVLQDVTLSWTPGMGASLHQVYFGDNLDEVSTASGAMLQTDTTYTPGALEVEKTYYWRVDEFDSAGTTHTGDVWSFTTVPQIEITDPSLVGWWTFDEGQGTTAVDWSGHGNHGSVMNTTDPLWVDGYQITAMDMAGAAYVHVDGDAWSTIENEATIALWVYGNPDRMPQNNSAFWAHDGSNRVFQAHIPWGDSNVYFDTGGSGYDRINKVATAAEYEGRWRHWTFVKNATTGEQLIYLDGVLWHSGTGMTMPMVNVTEFTIGSANSGGNIFPGMIDDVRLYNKALTAEEIQQVMLGNTKLAGSPVPDTGAIVDIRDISSLSWSKGDTAASHDVYFGTARDAMELQGNQTATTLSLADLVEFGGGDYYWRIDEIESGGTVIAGTVWKFTVPDYLIVDDFESYNDLNEDEEGSNRIYLTWIDGFGTTTNGAIAGNLDPPFMSAGHNSAQAMPLGYDNAGKTSEATRTLTSKKDWTVQGVTKLVIWFSGDSANAADRMYVALGNAVVYNSDDAATQDTGWNEWVIDLQEFDNQGANLSNVTSLTLGIGTRNAPVATGGTGTVEFDDIRLIR